MKLTPLDTGAIRREPGTTTTFQFKRLSFKKTCSPGGVGISALPFAKSKSSTSPARASKARQPLQTKGSPKEKPPHRTKSLCTKPKVISANSSKGKQPTAKPFTGLWSKSKFVYAYDDGEVRA